MFHSLRLDKLYLAEEVQYPLSPPPMWPTLQLTEEALSLLFCRLGPCPGRNAAEQWPVAQILKTKLDIQQKTIKSNRLWVKGFSFFFFLDEIFFKNLFFVFFLVFTI